MREPALAPFATPPLPLIPESASLRFHHRQGPFELDPSESGCLKGPHLTSSEVGSRAPALSRSSSLPLPRTDSSDCPTARDGWINFT